MRTRRRANLLRGYHQGEPLPCLSQFAVFFSHGAGFAIEVVMAFDAGHANRRRKHLQAAHQLCAKALHQRSDPHPITRDKIVMDDGWRIVACIPSQ